MGAKGRWKVSAQVIEVCFEFRVLIIPRCIPARKRGEDCWLLSNQVVGGVDKLDLGSEHLGFWHYMAPFMPDHTFTVNKLRGGYILDGFSGIRPTRIKAMEKALEGIRSGNPLVL
jgi:hypothetical protein